jgi:hypothetical protein
MFDYKPKLTEFHLKDCPAELLKGERFAFIKGTPRLLGSPHGFTRHGQSGMWVSDLLPGLATVADELTLIRSMSTDQFNHAPAELFLYTGDALPGKASLGSWLTYGLGSENKDLPGFVVLLSGGTDPTGGKSLWSSGFLPGVYQGVQCRSAGEASLANNCLLARRLVEKGVRVVQLYDWGWDIHGTGPGDDLMTAFPQKCREMDRPVAALIKDLKRRGLLDETLVVWGGEFGRTPMNEARGGSKFLGRDHHPHAFSMWMAGGGTRPGG